MNTILLVEDDLSLGEMLLERLTENYKVHWAKTVQEAKTFLESNVNIELSILDVNLPDGTGFDVIETINKTHKNMLMLFLTSQADAESRLKAYESGAIEFIPKPFHLKELLIRMKHAFESHLSMTEITLSHCVINFSQMSVQNKQGEITYPAVTDMKILKLLIEKSPQAISRDEILDTVWGVDKNPNHRTIDNTIVRIKKILGEDGEKIRSVRSLGYQWINEEN